MKTTVRLFVAVFATGFASLNVMADAAVDIARAQETLRRVLLISGQYEGRDVVLTAPAPLADKTGKYFAPYDANGALTAWAQKAIEATAGSVVGEKAGGMAVNAVGGVIPGAGLLSPFAKKKGKEAGAQAAVGGAKFIKSSSAYSFNSGDDLAVFVHAKFANSANYKQALMATVSVYPELETTFEPAIKAAYAKAEAVKAEADKQKAIQVAAEKAAVAEKAAKEKADADKAAAEKIAADKAAADKAATEKTAAAAVVAPSL